MSDKLFFDNSGGGITISGGEALLQKDFVLELLKMSKELGIHTAVDTCLQVSEKVIFEVLPYVDLWLIDIKETNPDLAEKYLGKRNLSVFDNLNLLVDKMKKLGIKSKIWIRTPLIPKTTMREENLKEIGKYINNLYQKLKDFGLETTIVKWELCTFNNLCEDKYIKLNRSWSYKNVRLLTTSEKNKCLDIAIKASNGYYRVETTGLVQIHCKLKSNLN